MVSFLLWYIFRLFTYASRSFPRSSVDMSADTPSYSSVIMNVILSIFLMVVRMSWGLVHFPLHILWLHFRSWWTGNAWEPVPKSYILPFSSSFIPVKIVLISEKLSFWSCPCHLLRYPSVLPGCENETHLPPPPGSGASTLEEILGYSFYKMLKLHSHHPVSRCIANAGRARSVFINENHIL